jgi:hypothetical protein
MDVTVYIPLYNAREWCLAFEPLAGFRYIAADNMSSDGSPDILSGKGVEVIRRDSNSGRLGNWRFCIEHFLRSEHHWMKWLFTGDRLHDDSPRLIQDAIFRHPEARLLIFAYLLEDAQRSCIDQAFPDERVLQPIESLHAMAARGNIFGSPIAQCFHREGLAGFDGFGSFEWAADCHLALHVSSRLPALFTPSSIGTFSGSQRKYFGVHRYRLAASIEEYELRLAAAQRHFALTGDRSTFEELVGKIEMDTEASIVYRAGRRARSTRDVQHLFDGLRLRHLVPGMARRTIRLLTGGWLPPLP